MGSIAKRYFRNFGVCCSLLADVVARQKEKAMNRPLRRVLQLAFSLMGHVLTRAKGPAAGSMEWTDDLPPFPIFSGEVARAEAALAVRVQARHRGLAV
jgi:hypothetical protein